jgi:hypothetical protein
VTVACGYVPNPPDDMDQLPAFRMPLVRFPSCVTPKSFVCAAKSSLGDAKSSLDDAKSSLGDAKSSLGDAKSTLSDAKSSLGDAKSTLGDAKSSLGVTLRTRWVTPIQGRLKLTINHVDGVSGSDRPYVILHHEGRVEKSQVSRSPHGDGQRPTLPPSYLLPSARATLLEKGLGELVSHPNPYSFDSQHSRGCAGDDGAPLVSQQGKMKNGKASFADLGANWEYAITEITGPYADIRIQLMDYDTLTKDDLIGTVMVPVLSLLPTRGEEITGWFDVIKVKGTRVQSRDRPKQPLGRMQVRPSERLIYIPPLCPPSDHNPGSRERAHAN